MNTFIVKGRPVSVNASRYSKVNWQRKVTSEASKVFAKPLEEKDLRIVITFFYNSLPEFDTDNMCKPICDCLQGIAYNDDKQLMERIARRRDINGKFKIKGIPVVVASAIAEGDDFVAITIEKIGKGVVKI